MFEVKFRIKSLCDFLKFTVHKSSSPQIGQNNPNPVTKQPTYHMS